VGSRPAQYHQVGIGFKRPAEADASASVATHDPGWLETMAQERTSIVGHGSPGDYQRARLQIAVQRTG
jgi:hypothetical protein